MIDDRLDENMDERSPEERRHDDRLDALVRELAMEYHRPPATPREAMWGAVASGLRDRGIATGSPSGIGSRESPASGRPGVRALRLPRYTAYALAASLLLAAGIGIGVRLGARPEGATVAQRAPVAPSAANEAARSDTARSDTGTAPSSERVAPARDIDRGGPAPGRQLAARDARIPTPDGERHAMPARDAAARTAYQLTTIRHLAQVEALLTSYRGDAAARAPSPAAQARADAQLATWARDLLTNTRLLLDSPAAQDPLRRRLLEDLELVLVQIVQLSPGTAADDRLLIERTLSREHVMTRLRTAIPAGQTSGT